MTKLWYWAPRLTGILAILFVSMFALDVFQAGAPFAQALIGLAVHLAPSAILAVLLAVAWNYERAGGFVFVVISLVPFFLLSNQVWVNALLCAPFLLTGILFIASSYLRKR